MERSSSNLRRRSSPKESPWTVAFVGVLAFLTLFAIVFFLGGLVYVGARKLAHKDDHHVVVSGVSDSQVVAVDHKAEKKMMKKLNKKKKKLSAQAQAQAQAQPQAEAEKDVIVLVFMPGCPACVQFHPVWQSWKQGHNSNNIEIAEVNGVTNPDFMREHNLMYFPSVIRLRNNKSIAEYDIMANGMTVDALDAWASQSP